MSRLGEPINDREDHRVCGGDRRTIESLGCPKVSEVFMICKSGK